MRLIKFTFILVVLLTLFFLLGGCTSAITDTADSGGNKESTNEKEDQPLEEPQQPEADSDGTSSPDDPGSDFFVFVDITNGNDGASGTKYDPVDDINEGINIAYRDGKDVCVAKGVYNIYSHESSHIIMMAGVSVYGGYSNDQLWSRNIEQNISIIRDLSAQNLPVAQYTVYFNSQTDENTVLDGFTIIGGNITSSYTILCNSAKGVISNNNINGSQINNYNNYAVYCKDSTMDIINNNIVGGSGDYSFGLLCNCGNLNIMNNTIEGGSGSDISYGVRVMNNANALIKDNDIDAGESNRFAYGIRITDSSPTIEENTINGGTSNASIGISASNSSALISNNYIKGGNGNDYSYGIHSADNTALNIKDNNIDSGSGNYSYCIYLYSTATPFIENNYLKCWLSDAKNRWGIYEVNNESDPLSVIGNVFNISLIFGSSSGLYQDCSGGILHSFNDIDSINELDENGYNLPFTTYDNTFSNIMPLY